jgi:S-formylglutathione hydrolase FrmB
MALIDCKFFSETLGMCSTMRVILPETTERRIGDSGVSRAGQVGFRGHPTVYLLHGMSDDESIWTRSTNIERYAAALGVAVVMPNVHRSFYTNMRYGYRYWDFVRLELIEKARSFFPLSHERDDNFVAGLSMGGHGAFKLALRESGTFAAAASMSGVADVAQFREKRALDFELIFGEAGPQPGSDDDVFYLATLLAKSNLPKPRLYQCCGTSDFLLTQNRELRDHLQPLGFDYLYEEGPGDHDWAYWEKTIDRALRWLLQAP